MCIHSTNPYWTRYQNGPRGNSFALNAVYLEEDNERGLWAAGISDGLAHRE